MSPGKGKGKTKPPYIPPPSPSDGAWRATRSNYQSLPVTQNADGSVAIAFPSSPETVNYVYSPAPRALSSGQRITITGEIRTTGTPIFHSTYADGYGAPPNLRLFVWAYGNTYALTPTNGRLWAPGMPEAPGVFGLRAGAFVLSAVLDGLWIGLDGHPQSDYADALAHATALGFTCGGGDAYGHGVSVTGGTAEIVITSFAVEAN